MDNQVTVLPDGSAFATESWPLPKDHWLYAKRPDGWDEDRDCMPDVPRPILTRAQVDAVREAARYAVKSSTMNGQIVDFDPDAMVMNFCYALCGPAGGALLRADGA